jgi:hypothetical protein
MSKRGGLQIDALFVFREQVDQDGADGPAVQHIGNMAISGAVTAAAAAMRKEHQSGRVRGQRKVSRKVNPARRNPDCDPIHFSCLVSHRD